MQASFSVEVQLCVCKVPKAINLYIEVMIKLVGKLFKILAMVIYNILSENINSSLLSFTSISIMISCIM